MAAVTVRTVRVVVQGRVHGVGFSWFVSAQARALGLSGWVRNRADGSVEFVARGVPADVEGLIADVRRGPPRAEVSSCVVDEADANEHLESPFAIR